MKARGGIRSVCRMAVLATIARADPVVDFYHGKTVTLYIGTTRIQSTPEAVRDSLAKIILGSK